MRRSKELLALLVVVLCGLGLGVAGAAAEPPQVTEPQVSDIASGTPHVEGQVDAKGESVEWFFEVSTDGTTWDRTSVEGFASENGPQTVEGNITGLNYGTSSLKAGTTYKIRLSALNFSGDPLVSSPEAEFTTESVNAPTVSIDPVTGVTASSATFSGEIDPNPPAGNPGAADVKWHFECTPECPNLQGGIISAGATGSEREVEAEATGLEPNTTYEVVLVAKNTGDPVSSAPVSFTTDAVGPDAETVPAFALGNGTAALIGGRVNPHNSATTYWIEYGPTSAYGSSAPVAEDGDAGSGGASVFRTEEVGGLTPGATYHFRFVAANASGTDTGDDMTFETPTPAPQGCPNEVLRSENNSGALPDCRAYEMVSPVDKNGNDVGITEEKPVYVAAEDGEALTFETYGSLPGAQSSKALNQNLSTRAPGGWSTRSIDPPAPENEYNDIPLFQYFSPNLDQGVLKSPPKQDLAPGSSPGGYNLYVRDNGSDTYRSLTGPPVSGPDPSIPFFYGASADFSHVAFESDAVLTPEAPLNPGDNNLYERVGDELRLVSILPNGEPAPYGTSRLAASGDRPLVHTVSEDGSRIVFETKVGAAEPEDPEERQIYLREDGTRTVQVSKSQRSIPDPFVTLPLYWGSSVDGSKVIFSSHKALTDDVEPGNTALYRYDADTEQLEDLTPNLRSGEPEVLGMSEDASYVYFRWVQGGNVGDIYLWHDGDIRYIASAGGIGCCVASHYTPRVSPSGRYLAFATDFRLTAYDNADAMSGQPDAEVYRYDAGTGQLSCASCRPSGEAPTGPAVLPEPPPFQSADRQHGVLDDGTVYFDSRDAVVPADSNGQKDVYEMRNGRVALISSGTSGDYSGFVGASLDGRDVFIVTRERLVSADTDSNRDVYDARIGGGFPAPQLGAGVCEGDECQGQASAQPPAGAPGSSQVNNPPRAAHHKKHRKHRRCRAAKGANGKKHRPKHCKSRTTKTNKGDNR